MLLAEVAGRLHHLSYDTAPEPAREAARLGCLDTVGVTLAGASSAAAKSVQSALGRTFAPGPATLFGLGQRVDVLNAALMNGVASHAHDFDDCSNSLGGHPSAPVLPALWALAEERRASGRELLSAYVAGVEVETRIARAVNFHHYEKGWHPTATLGVFGAAAASCHLMRLDSVRTTAALALAASMASGLKANFGTMAKPYHVGHCARNGLAAALMAEAGVTASPEALEHPQGFFEVYNGAGNYRAEAVLENWSSPLDLVEPGIAFKRHPCCASTHPAIDALLQLREAHGLRPGNVAAIRSWTHPRRLRHTNRPDPRTGLDGKFSVQYVLARALAQGQVCLGDFTDEAVQAPEIREIMSRVTAEPHPEARMDTTEHFFAEVTVTLADGHTVTASVDRPLGRDRDHPLPEGALEAKFLDCACQVLSRRAAEELADALLRLDEQRDVSALHHLVAGAEPALAG
ncbi:MmgE/PrpD family protein [Faunimonas sp. B44]|uniref:MmgE/PrpD family protein n=1 Tax=Faunimonas sp. B44 TaxID=3461493 RepID=UPI004043BDAF